MFAGARARSLEASVLLKLRGHDRDTPGLTPTICLRWSLEPGAQLPVETLCSVWGVTAHVSVISTPRKCSLVSKAETEGTSRSTI